MPGYINERKRVYYLGYKMKIIYDETSRLFYVMMRLDLLTISYAQNWTSVSNKIV